MSPPLIKMPESLRFQTNSTLVIFAFDGDTLVGTARAITDLEYHAGIYDVAVLPEYQGRGVGRQMMEWLLNRLKVWRVKLVCEPEWTLYQVLVPSVRLGLCRQAPTPNRLRQDF